ncbi:glycoside hydrolase [Myxococcota bacterium]|nr:glycoside hydrolase [Myxococcota bacterium]MBU1430854.1 glycoside hydrolase [Myxococcota bacterium]MBU1899033.1 glycoside hydrolase [Myxococcota bacterium]
MAPLHVALLWHMHQPSYRDPVSGALSLPWVRLHTARAYFDMAYLLTKTPQIKATFNFVPILVEQILAYVDGGERDLYWALTEKPAEALTSAERAQIQRHFFSTSLEMCIKPRPRFLELHQRRGQLSTDELRDLQVLFNLSWFGFGARESFPQIQALEDKGRGFTEADKRVCLDIQLELLKRVLPMYRALVARGQIEITATPYHHPILPLIIDTETMRRAQPTAPRPPRFAWPEDAHAHVARALDAHERVFGQRPSGMWPAEGSVSPEAAALFTQLGVRWIATDEAQLWNSRGGGHAPTELFKPHRYATPTGLLSMVFRDRGLSDLIGFTYGRNPAEAAVADLIGHLERIHAQTQADEAPFVLIALDGENPWEYYPQSGRLFLTALYAALDAHPDLVTTRISDHLDAHPPISTLNHLHSGSWINGDFGIWIGDPVDNQAWALLGETRAFFESRRDKVSVQAAEAAYEHLLQAQSSDWFWWYGEPFSSDNDEEFDALFRAHLSQVYAHLGFPAPAQLSQPLGAAPDAAQLRPPRALIRPTLGEGGFLDWAEAGALSLIAPNASMHQARRYFSRLRYGFDEHRLYLRLEPIEGAMLDRAALSLRLIVEGFEPLEFSLASPDRLPPPAMARVRGDAVELSWPFAGRAAGEVTLRLELLREGIAVDRFPAAGGLHITLPDPLFEARSWRL